MKPHAETAGTTPRLARLTVNLPWRVWQALMQIAEELQISKTEALRRAISTDVFRREIEREGGRFVIEWPDGTRERISFPY
jgi:hypothetical protein